MSPKRSGPTLSAADSALRADITSAIQRRRDIDAEYEKAEAKRRQDEEISDQLNAQLRLVLKGTKSKPTCGQYGRLVIDSRTWASRIRKLAQAWVARIGREALSNHPNACDGFGHRLARHIFEAKACAGASVAELQEWIDWARTTLEPMGTTLPINSLCEGDRGLVRYFELLDHFCDGKQWHLTQSTPAVPAHTCLRFHEKGTLLVGSKGLPPDPETEPDLILVLTRKPASITWKDKTYDLRSNQRVRLFRTLGREAGVWIPGVVLKRRCEVTDADKLVNGLRKSVPVVGALIESSRSGYRLRPGLVVQEKVEN